MKLYKSLSDGKKSSLLGGVLIVILIIILFNFSEKRNEELEKNSYAAFGIIEKLKPNAPKGTTTRKDVVYFYFVKDDTVFHKIVNLANSGIKSLGIKINDCFEVKVVECDHEIFKIDFNKKVNKFIDKKKYKIHIYNSERHRNLIELKSP
jgi:hypothetical protein